jgi:hypothetical protein
MISNSRILPAVATLALVAQVNGADAVVPILPEASSLDAVTVGITLLKSNRLQLTYSFPASCNQLPLKTPYPASQLKELRDSWKPANECGSVVNGAIARTASQCQPVVLDVPIKPTTADRVYPPAFPIGNLGVYVHTGIYAPTNDCGRVVWQIKSEQGDIVYDGENRGSDLVIPEFDRKASYMALYLSRSPLPTGTRTALSLEVPAWLRDDFALASSNVEAGYQKRFPFLTYTRPFINATSLSTNASFHQQAEVAAGNIIRYAFFNPPEEPKPADIASVRGIIAHEYGHKLQPEALRKLSGESDNLIHEGGAEYLRWSSMIRLGWFSAVDAQKDLNKALNTCLAIIGDQPWQAVADRAYGDVPNVCGLALHVLILASRRASQVSAADAVLESYYQRSNSGPVDFGQALECGQASRCKARWTPALLSSTNYFASEVDKLIGDSGLAERRLTEPPFHEQQTIAAKTLLQLMTNDCKDSAGFYHRDTGFEVSDSPDCKTFRNGMLMTHADGIALMEEPLRAARALVTQCGATHSAIVGMSDATEIRVQCGTLASPASHFYELDILKVLARLKLARAPTTVQ